jgi:hypothetical protein
MKISKRIRWPKTSEKNLSPDLNFDNFEIEEITNEEIQTALYTMKNAKSTGSDDIFSNLFKICTDDKSFKSE